LGWTVFPVYFSEMHSFSFDIGVGDLQRWSKAKELDFYRRVALLICGHGGYSITPSFISFLGR
jgi:hypothetical protein